ncbi:zinc finger protein 672-like [Amphibalanus amphitrite]|uniref:zinc finger protein 672-like n=1 Tax=Amphibalanus amphitrite TaxID=1232801 RepID=UPI001C901AFF|nr:zinc finger protein 672-like [Amphibalanus amphitrite]
MDFADGIPDIFIPGLSEDVLLCCDMCGEKHFAKECKFLIDAPRIVDGLTSRARVTLPSVLALRHHLDSSVTVVSTAELGVGTLFGPMVAPRTDHITNHQFPIKVFGGDGAADRYLDTRDEEQCNWMCLVTPSSEPHLQNLACIQIGDDIFYVVRRAVSAGTPLHVWYAPFYAAKLRHSLTSDLLAPADSDVTEVVLIREAETPPEKDAEKPSGTPGPAAELCCPLCPRRPRTAASLAAHLLKVHGSQLAALPAEPPPRCAICDAECTDGAALVAHLRSHRATHRCPHCAKVFTRRQTLAAHPCPGPRRAAQGWPCPHCGRLFTTAAAWRRHQRRHTGALRCAGCGRHFASASSRAAHACRAASAADRPHSCPQCARRFASAASLRQHAALHSDRFACPRCARRFSGAAPLRRHEALCGAGEQLARSGSVTCRRCPARLDSLSALAEHARQHELPHRCTTCGRRFRSRLQLGAHVCSRLEPERGAADRPAPSRRPARSRAAQSAPPPVVCEVCAQTFTSKKSLWLHRFTHAERQFACELCGLKFKRKDTMLSHLATHGQPMVPCPHCHKRFKSKKSLAVHVRLHTGDARFACDLCERRFVQKVNMLRHRRTHDPDHRLEFRCDVCGKCLSSAHHLKDHRLQHTQGRTHRCAACSRSFLKRRDLQRHMSVVHTAGQYECPFCHMTTRLKGSISRHLAKMHPAERPQWSAAGFLDSLHSAPARPAADSILTLEPDGTLLLAVPSGDAALDSSLARSPSAAVLADSAEGDQDVLLYVIDVPEMDITFDPPQQ